MSSGVLATPEDCNLVITGFMATGKTTVGRRLAALLDRPFVDTDAEIIKRAGKPIADIFAQDGEAAFRQMERDLVRELAEQRGLVIATGGGMLVIPENRDLLLRTAFVVCLNAPPQVIGARLSRERGRPLASNWLELFEKRRDAYAAIPNHIDTMEKTPDQVAQEIIARWRSK